jgi:hypothetical protein
LDRLTPTLGKKNLIKNKVLKRTVGKRAGYLECSGERGRGRYPRGLYINKPAREGGLAAPFQ